LKCGHQKKHTGLLSLEIAKSDLLTDVLKDNSKLSIISYCASTQIYELQKKLSVENKKVSFSEIPKEEDFWVVDFFGSKSGIRQLKDQSLRQMQFELPRGLVTHGIKNASSIAAQIYCREKSVVIKTNKGHAGIGVLLFKQKDLPNDFNLCKEAIFEKLSEEAYWDKFPIVIERYIDVDFKVGGGYPSVEFYINEQGKIKYLYYCGMRMSSQGNFQGVEINEDVLSSKYKNQLIKIGKEIAKEYSKRGYRGYFDVDCLVDKKGKMWITETNLRHTGGTHVYLVAKKLFGPNFAKKVYILSTDLFTIPNTKRFTFKEIKEILNPLLITNSNKFGIVITEVNLLSTGTFGYIIFGKNKKHAIKIEDQMKSKLKG